MTRAAILVSWLVAACGGPTEPKLGEPVAPAVATSALAPASTPPRPVVSTAPPTPLRAPAPTPAGARPCGAVGCLAFASITGAFDYVVESSPRVLAIGEAHAQSSGPELPSTTRRFMDVLLPRLAPRASDLVIELWLGNGTCGEVERRVEQQQRVVTAPQAATNQSEFVELGHRAKALGIMPHALVPTCEQYRKISAAGAADIEEMLVMLRDVTLRDVTQLLGKRGPERLIVAYGGALHNDLSPRAQREDFSFGPQLARATGERYIELDLIAPEQIKDTDAWRALPWYAAYEPSRAGDDTYLFSWAPHAFALVFPPTGAPATP